MNLKLKIIGLALAIGFTATAQDTNQLRQTDYAAFRSISQQNIFNQYRVARRRETSRAKSTLPVRMGDAFLLVGTMSYEKGDFAFFDGPSSEYRRIVRPADMIAGYKVTAITPASVTLESSGQKFEMKVGTQLRRNDEGGWQLADTRDLPAPPAGSAVASPAEPASSSSSEDMNDVLKKLMQKREQELK